MSPTVFKEGGYRFFFFSREESRMHVHVLSGTGEAKYWLLPRIALAKSYRFSNGQLKKIEQIIKAHGNELETAWNRHFKS
ncbi:MAG: DUF4160 domain-containing protein [Nitrospiria bacterium]